MSDACHALSVVLLDPLKHDFDSVCLTKVLLLLVLELLVDHRGVFLPSVRAVVPRVSILRGGGLI